MLGWEGYVVIILVVGALVCLFKDWADADFIFLGNTHSLTIPLNPYFRQVSCRF